MNERKNRFKKRLVFQQKMISRQSEKIDDLKLEIENLKLELIEKDKIIDSVTPLREELTKNVNEVKRYKKEYQKLILDLKTMKNIVNEEVFQKRWWLIRLLLR